MWSLYWTRAADLQYDGRLRLWQPCVWTRRLGGEYRWRRCLVHLAAWRWRPVAIREGDHWWHVNIRDFVATTGAPPDRCGRLLQCCSWGGPYALPWQRPRKVWAGWWANSTKGLPQPQSRQQKVRTPSCPLNISQPRRDKGDPRGSRFRRLVTDTEDNDNFHQSHPRNKTQTNSGQLN